ncbi:hypothetical protein [Chromobacterium violaceum]|uniref:Uncharacterized protein n=1 Tax=Chromobacterium violaceum TaxID=536 RepID=A0AAX2MEX7_CHRVL|nr:hypothetical protein [Chromobacterium violaceum]STB69424.1 Uncharacterised protein [Chromobacterium violaceum]SUY93311.1 Uncharacterised protein [Chromobacterium violaceum]
MNKPDFFVDTSMGELLAETRRNFAKRPRWWHAICGRILYTHPPTFIGPDDGLNEIYQQQTLLFNHGSVRWAALVQANRLLFEVGGYDHPLLLLHSADPEFDDKPQALAKLAEDLYRLKHTEPEDESRARLAQFVTDEMDRCLGMQLPSEWSESAVMASTAMFFRRYAPNERITGRWYPILTHPSTQAVLQLPKLFWPERLRAMWENEELY